MRTWAIVFLVLVLLLPAAVFAQGTVTLDTLDVQLWPEYDKPDMLVIYFASVSPDVPLPAQVSLRIPAEAKLHVVAVGKTLQEVSDIGVDYSVESQDGGKLVQISLGDDQRWITLEYYAPIARDGDTRHFVFEWGGEYAVDSFSITLKETVGSSGLETLPALLPAGVTEDEYRFPLHSLKVGALEAGQAYSLAVDYSKATNQLSLSGQKVEPIDGVAPGANNLPWFVALVLLVIALAAAGMYAVQAGRSGARPRARHAPRRAVDESATGDLVYCHQCGNRAKPGDRFCRTCGTRLRTGTGS